MGQSKALCEWIVEAYGARTTSATRFVAVRFGNVLGSSGSVIPIFRRQIEQGGPVDGHPPGDDALLHDDPRGGASSIVQAGVDRRARRRCSCSTWASRSRSSTSPRQMIRLSGKEPDRDIAIEFVGVRPGEKLHEELWGDGESVGASPHPKILAVTRPTDRRRLARGRARRAPAAGRGERDPGARLQARVDDEGAAADWRGGRRTPHRVTATPGSRRGSPAGGCCSSRCSCSFSAASPSRST